MPAVLSATAMPSPLRPRIVPTPEQLQLAFERRRRASWPATLQAAQADPLLDRLVHMEAVRQILQDARTNRRAELAHQQRLGWPASLHRTHQPTAPDRKRLAAGDTDDDR